MTEKRREVLFLIPSLRGGGAERVIVNLLRHLDRHKFRMVLAVVDLRDAAYIDDVPADVDVVDLGCTRVRYAIPRIAWLIRKRRPNVVFSTLGHLNLALAIIRPLLPNAVRFIARETSIVSATLSEYARASWWRWMYRNWYGRFDTVVCQSQYMRDDLMRNFNCPKDKLIVIHNPVDVDRIRPLSVESVSSENGRPFDEVSEPVINLVAVGRMVSVKGFDILIEALSLCRDSRLRVTLLGEGPLIGELECLAVNKGVASQVRFVGFQRNPFPFIANADAFVLSSRFEGFPNVVLEALACGTPVIATPAPGGLSEILQGMPGCDVSAAVSGDSLAAAIHHWLAHGERKVAVDAELMPYSVERIARQYEEVFLA